jgi:thiol-disulfide isomerase/thioredoxin
MLLIIASLAFATPITMYLAQAAVAPPQRVFFDARPSSTPHQGANADALLLKAEEAPHAESIIVPAAGRSSFKELATIFREESTSDLVVGAALAKALKQHDVRRLIIFPSADRQNEAEEADYLRVCRLAQCFLIDEDALVRGESGWSMFRSSDGLAVLALRSNIRDLLARVVPASINPNEVTTLLYDEHEELHSIWTIHDRAPLHDAALIIKALGPLPLSETTEAPVSGAPPNSAKEGAKHQTSVEPTGRGAENERVSGERKEAEHQKKTNVAPQIQLSQLSDIVFSRYAPGGVSLRASSAFEQARKHHQPILLVFWATWCAPCVKEMPTLDKLHQQYAPSVKFVGLVDEQNTKDTRNALDKVLDKSSFTTHYLLKNNNITRHVFSQHDDVPLPAFALFDRSGRLTKTMIGSIGDAGNYKKLSDALERAAHDD